MENGGCKIEYLRSELKFFDQLYHIDNEKLEQILRNINHTHDYRCGITYLLSSLSEPKRNDLVTQLGHDPTTLSYKYVISLYLTIYYVFTYYSIIYIHEQSMNSGGNNRIIDEDVIDMVKKWQSGTSIHQFLKDLNDKQQKAIINWYNRLFPIGVIACPEYIKPRGTISRLRAFL